MEPVSYRAKQGPGLSEKTSFQRLSPMWSQSRTGRTRGLDFPENLTCSILEYSAGTPPQASHEKRTLVADALRRRPFSVSAPCGAGLAPTRGLNFSDSLTCSTSSVRQKARCVSHGRVYMRQCDRRSSPPATRHSSTGQNRPAGTIRPHTTLDRYNPQIHHVGAHYPSPPTIGHIQCSVQLQGAHRSP